MPALAVVIVVDQMRADYVDRFSADWTGGLNRLVTRGASFNNTAFPYLTTVTCPGHATIATGTFPRVHGVFQNAWYERTSRRVEACTADSAVTGVRYPEGHTAGSSAARLLVPSLADQLRAGRPGARVATVSLKARAAIMLAGHGGDAVTWLSESLSNWETSSAFSAPVGSVRAFLEQNPMERDFGRVWSRRLPLPRYTFADDAAGEAPPKGWTPTFPHVLNGDGDEAPDGDFREQWARSPFANEHLGRLAAALVDGLRLGADETPDFLGVSFSTPDLVGHAFGPHSHEVQDIYAHLDATIGALLDHLDRSVGRDRYVVAFTSDHGVADLPEERLLSGLDGGRVNTTRIAEMMDRAAQAILGPGSYVSRVNGNDVYLEPGTYERLLNRPGAFDALVANLGAYPGIARVFRREQLADGHQSSDPLLRAAALSYVPRRSGDLVFALKPGWVFSTTGTTHGTANPDDQRVPMIFMGRGIDPGRHSQAATPADLAPTLAALLRIPLPLAEGRPLNDAFAAGR